MISALWNGLSGVETHSKAINVESTNVANVNTVGHKSDRISFESLMYQDSIGKGVSRQTVSKDFTQGGIKNTGVFFDAAIDGKGFFMVKEPDSSRTQYTRAGNFSMGVDGTLRTSDGSFVQGAITNVSLSSSSNPATAMFEDKHSVFIASQVLSSNTLLESFNAKSSDYEKSASSTGSSGSNARTAHSLISDIEALKVDYRNKLSLYASASDAASLASVSQISSSDFSSSLSSLNDASDFVEITIGNTHIKQDFDSDSLTTMKKFADRISAKQGFVASVDAQGVLSITSLVPGKSTSITNASVSAQVSINTSTTTQAVQGSGLAMVESSRDSLKALIELANGEFLEMNTSVSLAAEKALNVGNIQLKLDNLGLSEKSFGKVEIEDGIIFSKIGKNKFVIGKLTTATFTNLDALRAEGNNVYSKTPDTGEAIYAGDLNTIRGSALELSNSNLGKELTNLMVFQRGFEASAKSITTADEFLNIAIKLKK